MTLWLLVALAWPGAALTAYDLSVELNVNGRSVTTSPIRVDENEVAEFGAGPDRFVELRAAEGVAQGHRGIFMQIAVGQTDARGRRRIVSRPRILVRENEPATITLGDGDPRETLALKLTARRRLSRSSR